MLSPKKDRSLTKSKQNRISFEFRNSPKLADSSFDAFKKFEQFYRIDFLNRGQNNKTIIYSLNFMNRLTRARSKLLKTSSQAPSELLSSPPPRVSSYKYLRRTLILDPDDCKNLKKLVIKRIHVRKIIEIEKEDEEEDYESAEKRCFKKGLFKYLTHIKIYYLPHKYWLEDWKNSKKLTKFICRPYDPTKVKATLSYFERINKRVEEIDFVAMFVDISSLEFKKLYKNIRKFRELKAFRSKSIDNKDKDFIKQEFLWQTRYLQRLPYLQEFACYLPDEGQLSLRELMKGSKAYPKITKLYVNLEYLAMLQANLPDANKISPLFNFQVFPHLKEFTLKTDFNTEELLDSFDEFVVRGFQQLRSLEKLYLKLTYHMQGISFLFKGLLELPQLSTFSLKIRGFSGAVDWKTFITFTKKQTNFVFFKLRLCAFNEFPPAGFIKGKNGDRMLEEFFASLSQKPKLQHLILNADCWPLNPLSQGLKRLVETPQLKSLDLRTTNKYSLRYIVLPSEKPPFEGLCEFLVRNKETLEELSLDIPLLEKQEYNKGLNEAISQLYKIKCLWLQILTAPLQRKKNCHKQGLDINLDSLLPHLERLQELKIDFEDAREWSQEDRKWMGKSFKILPSLKNLRRFEFLIPADKLFEAEAETISLALEGLKQVVYLNFFEGKPRHGMSPHFKNVSRGVKILAAQRHLCISLSF